MMSGAVRVSEPPTIVAVFFFFQKNPKNKIKQSLFERLRQRWDVVQRCPNHKEIIINDQDLLPGELGNALEHILGYYYVQEVSSMMSALALDPRPEELILDVCASPG